MPPEKIEYKPEFRIIEVDKVNMACQKQEDIVLLFKKLSQCKDNGG
jgi:hypothetical protein